MGIMSIGGMRFGILRGRLLSCGLSIGGLVVLRFGGMGNGGEFWAVVWFCFGGFGKLWSFLFVLGSSLESQANWRFGVLAWVEGTYGWKLSGCLHGNDFVLV